MIVYTLPFAPSIISEIITVFAYKTVRENHPLLKCALIWGALLSDMTTMRFIKDTVDKSTTREQEA
jgi:hypothetical protein